MQICKEDIYGMIARILEVNIEIIKNMNEDDDFAIHGMTSISAIQLVVELEGEYDFEFPDEDLLIDKFNTPNKLFALLEGYE